MEFVVYDFLDGTAHCGGAAAYLWTHDRVDWRLEDPPAVLLRVVESVQTKRA